MSYDPPKNLTKPAVSRYKLNEVQVDYIGQHYTLFIWDGNDWLEIGWFNPEDRRGQFNPQYISKPGE